jgi:hypothetical protein
MNQISKKTKMLLLAMMMSLAIPMLVNAQPAPPDGDDVDTPFDGGISLVLAAGGILGAKKMRDNKKKNTVEL